MNSYRDREDSGLFSHQRPRSVLVALAFCAFCVLLTPSAFAQSGAVLGVVNDTSGAVIPDASVTITNAATGVTTATKTNNEGLYDFPYVQPGVYTVSAGASGFQTVKKPGVTVHVTERVQLGFNLQIGSTKQSVTVTGAAPLLNTINDAGGQTISRTVINDLPLLNRSALDLAFLAPGVNQPAGSTYGNQSISMPYLQSNDFVSNGSREATSNVLIDGVSAGGVNSGGLSTRVAYTPSVDGVEEFKVQQTNFSAEYGNSGSTIVNLITRSGSNRFHGSAYDFLRNNDLDAADYFENQNPAPLNKLPHLERNVFGGTVGGPIFKNRTFFFFDYEGTRQSSLASAYAGVPSAAERSGDFGELCNDVSELDGNGTGTFNGSGVCSDPNGQLWDPYTAAYDASTGNSALRSAPIPNNNIATYTSPGAGYPLPGGTGPGNMIDPAAKKLMSFFPSPNFNQGAPGGGYSPYYNWVASGATGLANHQWDLKIDQNFGDRNRLSGKYAQRLTHQINLNCFNNIADPCSGGVGPQSARLLALDFIHTFGPATVLNVSYGYTSVGRQLTPSAADPVTALGMPSYIDQSGFKVLPSVLWNYSNETAAEAANNDTAIGGQPWSILEDNTASHDLLASLTHIHGRNELKFGAEFLINLYNFSQPGTQNGLFSYGPAGSSQNSGVAGTGGDNLASFLIGSGFGGWGQYEIPAWLYTQNHGIAGYAQDAFRASKKLTVNVGIRYDLTMPETERHNELSWLDVNAAYPSTVPGYPILHGGLAFAGPGERSALNPDYKDFSPRVGLAYTLNEKTVIRTGYGIYYGMSRAAANAYAITPNDPGFDGTTSWPGTYNYAGLTPCCGLSNPFPNGITPVTGSSLGLATQIGNGSSAPNGFERTMNSTPYSQSWNFGIQRELPERMLLNVEYIGQESTHQYFGIGGNYNIDHLGAQEEKMSPMQLQALTAQVANPFSGIIPNSTANTTQYQLDLPYPQFNGFDLASPPWANANYQALQLGLEKRFSNGLSFLVTYVWSKSLDDDSNPGNAGGSGLGTAPLPVDPNNLKLARSVSQYNIPQVFQFSYDYHLPFGRGQHFGAKMSQVLDAIVGGWQTTGIWRFDDGQPMIVEISAVNPGLPGYGQAPELVGTPHANAKSQWFLPESQGGGYFGNPQVFQQPAPYTIGDAPRTIPWMHYPGTANADLSLFKEFSMNRLREGMHLELRTEWFNALNHPQFGNVNTTVSPGNSAFGQITGPDANSPRQIQMALKFYF
ncbi:MAG: carboxypeptidase regulatory-like domain-containing protein [Terriglobia bacterium]